jgi:hypothetical protein
VAVRTIREASEAEVLECFWSGELSSTLRWRPGDVEERQRQWRERDGLFAGFPDDVRWERAALTRDEVLAILYIDWDWWLTVSNGTRLATVAAEVQGRDEGDRAIAAAVSSNPELIVVTDPKRSKLVLLEGARAADRLCRLPRVPAARARDLSGRVAANRRVERVVRARTL